MSKFGIVTEIWVFVVFLAIDVNLMAINDGFFRERQSGLLISVVRVQSLLISNTKKKKILMNHRKGKIRHLSKKFIFSNISIYAHLVNLIQHFLALSLNLIILTKI